jgi:hypothetical protein
MHLKEVQEHFPSTQSVQIDYEECNLSAREQVLFLLRTRDTWFDADIVFSLCARSDFQGSSPDRPFNTYGAGSARLIQF